jgi:hypothetical protein
MNQRKVKALFEYYPKLASDLLDALVGIGLAKRANRGSKKIKIGWLDRLVKWIMGLKYRKRLVSPKKVKAFFKYHPKLANDLLDVLVEIGLAKRTSRTR